jgi:hypothetical protein
MSNARMTRLPALLAVLAVAACASQASMNERYDASLQRWKGATRAELEAAWGRPMLAQATPDGLVLAWVKRTDIDDRPGAPGSPAVVVARAGGAVSGTTVMPSVNPLPAAVPITCTTRFLMKDDRVASWTFKGLGCGAPY